MSGMHQPVSEVSSSANAATEPVLHAIDPEDVALSDDAVRRIVPVARELIRRFIPGIDHERATLAQVMSLFADHAFWEERTGGLLLCADMAERSLCLPIPRDHWRVRIDGVVYH